MGKIKKNFFYSSLLSTANYIFPIITYPYVSRVLGVTNIGLCNFIDSIINYFVLLSMMGIGIVGIREVSKNKGNREELNKIFSGLFFLNTISTLFALIILLGISIYVEQLYSHREMMIIGSLKLIMSYMLIEWLYKGLEEFRFITIRSLLIRVIYVLSVFLFVRDSDDYLIYYFLSAFIIIGNALVNIVYSKNYVTFIFRGMMIKPLIKPYFTLGIYYLLTSMYTSFNVAYLGFVSGDTEVGYYSTASKLYYFFVAFFSAFTNVMLPRMSSLLSDGKPNEFYNLLHKSNDILFTCSIPFIMLTIVFAPNIIRLLAGEGYEGAILPMRIIMPLLLIIGYEQIVVIQALTPLKKDGAIFLNSIIGAFLGIVLNFVLVPEYKSVGSSLVWLFCEITVLVCSQFFLNRAIHSGFPWKILLNRILYNVPLLVFFILLNNIIKTDYSFLFSSLFLLLYFYITNVYIIKNSEMAIIISGVRENIHIFLFRKVS